MGDTRVLAPSAGVIERRMVNPGEHVNRNVPLFTLVRGDVLELAAAVPERAAAGVQAGQSVRFTADGGQFEGRVARISPSVDPTSRSVTVYVQVPNADGRLRALGVTSAKRKPEAKDIPTLAEAGVPGFEATLLTGVVAPAGTPAPIVAKLNAAINDGLRSDDLQAMLAKFGSSPRIETPQAFTAFIAGEKQKWSEVAKKAGVSLD